jgi:hypothetical protein
MDETKLAPNSGSFDVGATKLTPNISGETGAESEVVQTLDTKLFATRRRTATVEPPPSDVYFFPRFVQIQDLTMDLMDNRTHRQMSMEGLDLLQKAPKLAI